MVDLVFRQAYERMRWNKIGYTLVELLVVMSIILILSSLGVFAYHLCLVYARETVCETNLNALEKAVDLYSVENDALPASLGRLKREHLEKGYAKAMEDGRWLKKFCFFLIKLDTPKQAYAQFLTYENLKASGILKNTFRCPADGNGGASYGINSNIEGKKWSEVGEGVIIVADSNAYTFSTKNQLAKRHNHKAIGITKADEIVNVTEENVVLIDGEEAVGVVTIEEEDDTLITICHKENTPAEKTKTKKINTKKTMSVRKSDLFKHLMHGDTLGPCQGD